MSRYLTWKESSYKKKVRNSLQIKMPQKLDSGVKKLRTKKEGNPSHKKLIILALIQYLYNNMVQQLLLVNPLLLVKQEKLLVTPLEDQLKLLKKNC
jgi:hypothetical protein